MSISLKVVRSAFVFWASLSLREIVYRILLILTRVSTRVPLISFGADFAVCEATEPPCGGLLGAELTGATGAAGVGAALGVSAAFGASLAGVGA